MPVRYFLVLVLLAAGCAPDVAGECRKVVDEAKTDISDDVANRVAEALAEFLPLAVRLEMLKFGCVARDGGQWSCAGSTLCEAPK